MKAHLVTYLLGILLLFAACNNQPEVSFDKEVFSGYAQKGPFNNGSNVTISELDNALNPTGNNYNIIINNNNGSFQQNNLQLISGYVQLKVDGYFFDEVKGRNSSGPISLYAIADIANRSSANVNILTHLEKGRIEYLIKEEGLSFAEAKKQAQKEVLDIFSFTLSEEKNSELMNLTQNGILLAVSCIVNGYLSSGDMSELIANICTDIIPDGKLDDPQLRSRLAGNARMLNTEEIRKNLEKKYAELNMDVTIPGFESYVTEFINNTPGYVSKITYPAEGIYGANILSDDVTEIYAYNPKLHDAYSMKAELPEGFNLKIVIKDGYWSYMSNPLPINWFVNFYDGITKSQIFSVIEGGKPNDLRFCPESGDSSGFITIDYYENDADEPTKTRKVKVLPARSNNVE